MWLLWIVYLIILMWGWLALVDFSVMLVVRTTSVCPAGCQCPLQRVRDYAVKSVSGTAVSNYITTFRSPPARACWSHQQLTLTVPLGLHLRAFPKSLGQELVTFICEELPSQYFWPCGPRSLCGEDSALQLQCSEAALSRALTVGVAAFQ